jgi:hypothetical protein
MTKIDGPIKEALRVHLIEPSRTPLATREIRLRCVEPTSKYDTAAEAVDGERERERERERGGEEGESPCVCACACGARRRMQLTGWMRMRMRRRRRRRKQEPIYLAGTETCVRGHLAPGPPCWSFGSPLAARGQCTSKPWRRGHGSARAEIPPGARGS